MWDWFYNLPIDVRRSLELTVLLLSLLCIWGFDSLLKFDLDKHKRHDCALMTLFWCSIAGFVMCTGFLILELLE